MCQMPKCVLNFRFSAQTQDKSKIEGDNVGKIGYSFPRQQERDRRSACCFKKSGNVYDFSLRKKDGAV